MVRPTFLDDEPHGIYASRHPCRPNGIGMSIIRLEERQENILTVRGIDVLDETLLLDIKPYIPKFDIIESASNGWVIGNGAQSQAVVSKLYNGEPVVSMSGHP